MLSYNPEDPVTVNNFYHTTHSKLWKVLFKPQKTWLAQEEDTGLNITHPRGEIWLEKSKWIISPTLLPEGHRKALFTAMLVEKPYVAQDKKENRKEARGGLRYTCLLCTSGRA
ncbi:e3 ubiquitin-protein ligase ari8 [Hordeum vulgare]|nr:e3 ubiquitin-protein ligase ari8 [Hordeum vulgare]